MKKLTVFEWNDEIIVILLPNIVVLSVYLFVGICGNVLVLLVYGCQIKNSSDERYFIIILAACDLIATLHMSLDLTKKDKNFPMSLKRTTKLVKYQLFLNKLNPQRDEKRITELHIEWLLCFFIITLLFFICYIPKLILILTSGIYQDFAEKLSTSQRPAAMFVNDMFIINNIVNPFIYAFMNTKFRSEAPTFLKRAING
ncbi:uncharacterized protein LOC127720886 [Mytilus californianus]|uniref:uncharacterized protein LOC127720886 n=1 Tax=Mytilus californianus TaxID=6549 RepID=UPI00224564BC|nr:uncharacterized protein LOC127720886 [Mytilus californianus]